MNRGELCHPFEPAKLPQGSWLNIQVDPRSSVSGANRRKKARKSNFVLRHRVITPMAFVRFVDFRAQSFFRLLASVPDP
jgi:hypothetical protein